MKIIKYISLSLLALYLLACTGDQAIGEKSARLAEGSWLFKMQLSEVELPFDAQLTKVEDAYQMTIVNADERIEIKELFFRNDSLIIPLPVFESTFYLKILDSLNLEGEWVNYYKSSDYKIKVQAEKIDAGRFSNKNSASSNLQKISSKYEVSFSPGTENEYKAIGLFEQKGKKLSGTFATETGDYRYLDGVVSGDSLFLSTFDGSHAFYFSAKIVGDSLAGVFISGTHFQENWTAIINEDFELRDPEQLTSSDSSAIRFSLENESGEKVSLNDDLYKGKVKLIQIMGSWCPNCLDESVYFNELKTKYQGKDLEIIGIAFERTKNKEKAFQNLNRLRTQKGIDYTILLGGYNRDQHPMDIFPMLNHIMSYPTTLYLDKQNKIRKIYTGFYGPGTGQLYKDYKIETERFLDELIQED